ncbi:RdgB/HAM1 family non-canonical purine NTP pyrophosphatase [Candidatus Micrarchaeota archaeon]|nr:RdgB/HAM1 family non-canonical purine NTP pyrophosphatase [Candidatus Micrarchaeota archaeon]
MLHFVTTNKHKFQESALFLKKHSIPIDHIYLECPEIRSDSFEEIAANAAEYAYKRIKKPLFVEDSGLCIKALQSFPGTFSSWTLKKIGLDGILKLMKSIKNREAEFISVIAYCNEKGIKTFKANCIGTIAVRLMGIKGFGYDPIFIPTGYTKTFGQDFKLKNKLSHRVKALEKFASYLNGD